MATFNERLKELRKEKNVTLEQMAKDLETTKATLSRYENGLRDPKTEITNKFAEYFNVSVDYLMGKTNVRDIDKKIKFDVDSDLNTLYKKIMSLGKDKVLLVNEFADIVNNGIIDKDRFKLLIDMIKSPQKKE